MTGQDALDLVLGKLDGVVTRGGYWMARCPARDHEDQTQSLSVTRGDGQPVIFKCHAGCERDDILDGLGLSLDDVSRPRDERDNRQPQFTAIYDYVDEHGGLLFEVCRKPAKDGKKDFPQRRPDGRGGWIWGLGSTRRVLYRLPRVIEAVRNGQTVYIAEGEKDVQAIERAGGVATCNPGGARKWRGQTYNPYLAGARVIIIADRDEPGRLHAMDVAGSLSDVAGSVTIVEAACGKDAYDHLEGGHGLGDLVPVPGEGAAADAPDEEKAEKRSAATILVEVAQALYEFGVSEDGETYGVPRTGPKVVLLLRGGTTSLRAQLAREYFRRKDRAAPQQALADALLTLDGFAQECRPRRLWQRVARHGDALWLDLGDASGQAVQISAAGWTVADRPPVLFRRTVLTGALPRPVPGGDLAELWKWVNVATDDRPLIAAELVDRLWPDHPHVVTGLFGEQGSGKSTAAKVLALVVDPGPVPLRKPPRDAEAWVTAAAGSWVVALDNLSGMPDWLSDSICRASTGEGDVRRKLYTDGQLATFAFRRCVLLTGIDLGALNGDLAERLLSADLTPISEAERLDEEDLWPQWGQVHPRLLGALLDLAASVVSSRPSVRLARKPRMADYARTLAAVDGVLGTDGLIRYMGAQARMASEALTGDLFITAVAGTLDGTGFTGTAAELLTLVTPADDTWRPPKGWPATARGVTQRLHRQAPVMRKAGWSVSDDGGENKQHATRWQISAPTTEVGRNPSSPSSPCPESSPDPDETGTPARMASYASNDSDLPTWTCAQCGLPLDPYLAGLGDTTHPNCQEAT